MAGFEDAVQELSQVPLPQFVDERKRLAGELKSAGDATAAKQLLARKRPTISAWVVNQLYWHARDAFEDLLATAERLRKGDLKASAAHRDAIAKLRGRAKTLLEDAGNAPTEATLRRVATTLAAIAVAGGFDPDPPGALAEDRDPPGFAAFGIAGDEPAPKPEVKPKAAKAKADGAKKPAKADPDAKHAKRAKSDDHDDDDAKDAKRATPDDDKDAKRATSDGAHAEDDDGDSGTKKHARPGVSDDTHATKRAAHDDDGVHAQGKHAQNDNHADEVAKARAKREREREAEAEERREERERAKAEKEAERAREDEAAAQRAADMAEKKREEAEKKRIAAERHRLETALLAAKTELAERIREVKQLEKQLAAATMSVESAQEIVEDLKAKRDDLRDGD